LTRVNIVPFLILTFGSDCALLSNLSQTEHFCELPQQTAALIAKDDENQTNLASIDTRMLLSQGQIE
jgi:hypothetical protein